MSEIAWIDAGPGRVAVIPRPRGDRLDDEARDWKTNGADVVVSLLETDEARLLGLEEEREAVEAHGMTFYSFPIPDGGTPDSMSDAAALVDSLVTLLKEGKAVGVHCRAGLGRSPMIAAAALVESGVPLGRALKAIAEARGWPVPETEEQLGWLERFATSRE